ncbi:ABC transporter permease [Clostridium sp. JN-9]|uniref:ABC transporter permease n=1 Tax=Clostridium sp. JN-9 TaxID=2507159 RepID=UPI000FFE21D3|nr:ABC transporter permease [Clostridium sp. JN-9]QAT39623.1 ABC transporter permease [Clostridium sp. JN-9]
MLKVLKNEFIKMFKEKKFYIIAAILIGSIILMAFMKDPGIDAQNFVFETFAGMVIKPMLPAFMIIVISGVITEDYVHGTMKFSLITPIKRRELIAGKFLFIYLYAVILLAISFLTSYIVCVAVFGTSIQVQFMKNFLFNIKCYAYILLPLLSFCTLISFIAMFVNSIGEIIGIGLGIQFMTVIIEHSVKSAVYFLAGGGMYIYDFVRASGDLNNIHMLLVTLCACIYIAVFMLLSMAAMKKKDLVL